MNRSFARFALCACSALALVACAPDDADDDLLGQDLLREESVGSASQPLTFGNISSAMQVVNSGHCMTVAQQPSGIWWVVQQPCVSDVSMRFYARPIPGSATYFSIEAMGRCLDVPSSSTASGVDLQLYPCHRNYNQQFRLFASADGYEIRPRSAPALCLDVEGANSTPGMLLQQHTCNNQGNQRFRIRPTMSDEIFDCDAEDGLYLGWPDPTSADPYNNPLYATINDGQIVYFNANHVRWSEGPSSGAGWWDDEKICAAGTTTIEISRHLADRDEFRLRCFK